MLIICNRTNLCPQGSTWVHYYHQTSSVALFFNKMKFMHIQQMLSGSPWLAVHLPVYAKRKVILPVPVLQPGWTLPRPLSGLWLEIAGRKAMNETICVYLGKTAWYPRRLIIKISAFGCPKTLKSFQRHIYFLYQSSPIFWLPGFQPTYFASH